jgi:hypothetical protein
MRYFVIILFCIGFLPAFAEETESIVLTPFDIILSEDDFTLSGPNHQILILEPNTPKNIPITIQSSDKINTHNITINLSHRNLDDSLFTYSFESQTVKLEPNSHKQIIINIQSKNSTDNPHTSWTTLHLLAQSDIFGMTGKYFYLIVGNNVTDSDMMLIDKSLRAGFPGSAFPHIDTQISEDDAEKMIDNGFGTPSYLPNGYQFRGITDFGDSKQFVYSPSQVDNSTESFDFLENGGMLIHYNNYSDKPNVNNTKSLPVRIAQDEGQQVMINGLMGMAIEKQTRVVMDSDLEYDAPAEVEFFDDVKRASVSLKANMPLADLLKVASSISIYEKEPIEILVDMNAMKLESPLKQFHSGIPFNEIQCKDSLILIQKYDGSPACVKPETKTKLIERGWSRVENSITITDTDMTINYQMSSGKISSILGYSKEASGIGQLTQTSLFLMLDTTENGDLTLILPRDVIDAKVGDIDDGFLVILDEMETEFTETKSVTHRTISFSFPAGTKIVEIIGYGFYNEKFSDYPG